MGGGAFRFFGINIYQVALYIDTQRAASSPLLLSYTGQGVEQLQKNESFYAAMMSGEVNHPPTHPPTYLQVHQSTHHLSLSSQ